MDIWPSQLVKAGQSGTAHNLCLNELAFGEELAGAL